MFLFQQCLPEVWEVLRRYAFTRSCVDGSMLLCVRLVLCYQELAASRSAAYASLTGRARQLALEEFKAEMSGAWQAAGGQQQQQMAADGDAADNESESSMPCSLPSDLEASKNKRCVHVIST